MKIQNGLHEARPKREIPSSPSLESKIGRG